MELVDYDFTKEENYGADYIREIPAFCELCDADLDHEEANESLKTGFACCTKCLYDEEAGPHDLPAWEDQVAPGWRMQDLIGEAFPTGPQTRVINLKPKTESEKTLLRGNYRETFWKLRITSGAARLMLLHASFKFPNETGGLCFGPKYRKEITHVTWLGNTSAHPRGLYEPDGQEWFNQMEQYRELGLEWKAWWHSHPGFSPLPSGIDTGWHKHPVHMLICNPKAGEIRGYDWDKKNPKELREIRMEVKQ